MTVPTTLIRQLRVEADLLETDPDVRGMSNTLRLLREAAGSLDSGLGAEAIRIARLRYRITVLEAAVRRKNTELDALHFVWCSGGCLGGIHRHVPGAVTEELVTTAERNTARLRTWFTNAQHRARRREPCLHGQLCDRPDCRRRNA